MLDVDRLPQLGRRFGQVVDRFQDAPEGSGEDPVEVDVAEHDPGVSAPDLDVCDPLAWACGDTPLLGGSLDVLGRIVGLVDVGLEGVIREVVVRGADEGVGQDVAHQPQGAVVVARDVVVVDDDLHAELLGQVEEVLLLVADDDRHVRDAGLVQLADLSLDQDLPAHAQHPFGALVGDRREALGQAGRHDDGVAHPVGFQGRPARLGQVALLNVAGRLALAHGGVDPPQGHAGGLLDLALGEGIARPQEGVEHIELRL